MACEEDWNAYEELRKKNVERNLNVMRMLGLCSTRGKEVEEKKTGGTPKCRETRRKECCDLRRSSRIAALQRSSLQSKEIEFSGSGVSEIISRPTIEGVRKNKGSRKTTLGLETKLQQVLARKREMEEYNIVGDDYSTDSSSDSFYEVHVDMDGDGKKSMTANALETQMPITKQTTFSSPSGLDSSSSLVATLFGTHFQELVMKAVMQSTAALIGPPSSIISSSQGGFPSNPLLCTQGVHPFSTWNKATYNKGEAKRKKKPKMMRTSAGEDSDSQKDFPVAENESPQQKSLRIRRLNRSRARRAKELTSNRKAMNKLPYVLHVDGVGKAKGIHKHQWRAAVRGQCGRLDPTMDNINHHPKHVVDSIWHALEKEWEFEGFMHRAREMFEKSATKFMRNRKMQLKYKCQKVKDGKKPDDVNDVHWKKIVKLTRNSTKLTTSSASMQTTAKGKEKAIVEEEEEKPSPLYSMWSEDTSGRRSPVDRSKSDSGLLENDDVEARIQSLQNELMRLKESRKVEAVGFSIEEDDGTGDLNTNGGEEGSHARDKVLNGMKENLKPGNGSGQYVVESYGESASKKASRGFAIQEKKSPEVMDALREIHDNNFTDEKEQLEMDCDDVVCLFAINGGVKKEIGKGIVMALAGSKYAKKIIPKGWRNIKVTSYTSIGAGESCPFPTGWSDGVKHRTVKDANGRMIVWPDSLLQSLLQK